MSSNVNQSINNTIVDSVRNEFLEKVHNRADQLSNNSDNIYTSIKSMGYETFSPESIKRWQKTFKQRTNSHLMNEVLMQMVEEFSNKQKEAIYDYINSQIKNLNLKPTSNPQFMVSADGKFFRLNDCDYIEEPSVVNIDIMGNYTVKQKMDNSHDYLVTTYDMNNKPISMKIVNSNNEVYKSERFVAKKLNLKQEFVNKYKLHGYSGNSFGLLAAVGNMITSPVPSGHYFDKSYSFFKWNTKAGEFEINRREGNQVGSPLMSDYDIRENIVIRTDYDGVGICL